MKAKKYIFILIPLLSGFAILLYPFICNYINSLNQSKVLSDYQSIIENTSQDEIEALFASANEYNEKLFQLDFPLIEYNRIEEYENLLNIDKNGIMGYLTIEKINVNLPVYHGTSKDVLAIGCGHIKGTSLPVGGKNTHSVISAHCGYSKARLFTDLYKMEIGDTFTLHILNRKFDYVVDQLLIVNPNETNDICIIKGEDYCSLSTCTPYGVNTYRRFVRGKRR